MVDDRLYLDEFQSTHPHGVRLTAKTRCFKAGKFQSTHPHGVRQCRDKDVSQAILVSIHAPTRGATYISLVPISVLRVSIHAPTRGATHKGMASEASRLVSIHAPTRGATAAKLVVAHYYEFQSTHPHGVRLDNNDILRARSSFNPRTHTGCDIVLLSPAMEILSFNPRTHTGCDSTAAQGVASLIRFQSTHPHGVRPSIWA